MVVSNQSSDRLHNSHFNLGEKKMVNKGLRVFFTKHLTFELIHKLCNVLDDWLDWLIPTNHRTDYITGKLTQGLKVWWIRAIVWQKQTIFIFWCYIVLYLVYVCIFQFILSIFFLFSWSIFCYWKIFQMLRVCLNLV